MISRDRWEAGAVGGGVMLGVFMTLTRRGLLSTAAGRLGASALLGFAAGAAWAQRRNVQALKGRIRELLRRPTEQEARSRVNAARTEERRRQPTPEEHSKTTIASLRRAAEQNSRKVRELADGVRAQKETIADRNTKIYNLEAALREQKLTLEAATEYVRDSWKEKAKQHSLLILGSDKHAHGNKFFTTLYLADALLGTDETVKLAVAAAKKFKGDDLSDLTITVPKLRNPSLQWLAKDPTKELKKANVTASERAIMWSRFANLLSRK